MTYVYCRNTCAVVIVLFFTDAIYRGKKLTHVEMSYALPEKKIK